MPKQTCRAPQVDNMHSGAWSKLICRKIDAVLSAMPGIDADELCPNGRYECIRACLC